MAKTKRAVMVSLNKTGEDRLRITLDDFVQGKDNPALWNKDLLITFKEYDTKTFEALEFTEKELADFGYAILARLWAFLRAGEI